MAEKMKICFFSHSSDLAGAERSLLELITELQRDYLVKCTVVLPSEGELETALEAVGAETILIEYSWWCNTDETSPEEIELLLNNSFGIMLEKIQDVFRDNLPDVICTSTLVIPWGAIAASFFNLPHVWFIQEYGQADHGFKFHLGFSQVLEFIQETSNHIVVNSQAVKNTLFKTGCKTSLSTIYYHIPEFEKTNNPNIEEYFKRPKALKLFLPGTITESKGQLDAVLGVKELVAKNKNVELIILGKVVNQSYMAELERIIATEQLTEYIKFEEFVNDPSSLFNQTDIVLVCSRNEAFGRVTVEAMLAKKPVIGTDSGGTKELIRNGKTGSLYTPGKYTQLAEKIEYFISHPEKKEAFGAEGYQETKKKFTVEQYGGKFSEIFRKVINTNNPVPHEYMKMIKKIIIGDTGVVLTSHRTKGEQIAIKDKHILDMQNQLIKNRVEKDRHIKNLQDVVREKDRHIKNLQDMGREKEMFIQAVIASRGWKVLLLYFRARDRLFPHGSKRRRALSKMKDILRGCSIYASVPAVPAHPVSEEKASKSAQPPESPCSTVEIKPAPVLGQKEQGSQKIIHALKEQLEKLEQELEKKQAVIDHVYSADIPNSRGFILLMRYYKYRDSIFPIGSKRRRISVLILKCLNFKKIYFYIKNHGLKNSREKGGRTPSSSEHSSRLINMFQDPYQNWINQHRLNKKELVRQRKQRFNNMLKISVVANSVGMPINAFKTMIDSIFSQTYSNWELFILIDKEMEPLILKGLEKYIIKSKKTHLKSIDTYLGSADAFVQIAEIIKSEYVVLMHGQDELSKDALYKMANWINQHPEADFIYTDEDQIDETGQRIDPKFKPDWSPDTLLSYNYIGNSVILKKNLLSQSKGEMQYKNQTVYAIWLQATGIAQSIQHIPEVLYHARKVDSTAKQMLIHPIFSNDGESIRKLILASDQPKVTVAEQNKYAYMFSLIILNKNAPQYIIPLLKSLVTPELNQYYEVVVGDTGTTDKTVLDYYQAVGSKMKIVKNLKYHFSRNYNELVLKYSRGKYVALMNNDLLIDDISFLHKIELAFSDQEIGIVGSKLLYPDGRLQHGGIFFMQDEPYRGLPYHRLHGKPDTLDVKVDWEKIPAVTGAFLFCDRQAYIEVGGLDDKYQEEAQDVDLCLKFRQMGKEILFMNQDKIIHVENGTRPKGSENWHDREYFIWKWCSYLEAAIFDTEMNSVH
ncbi:glycosyltransferase [bacterium]|nr:glycosyltransferase [bacterium]